MERRLPTLLALLFGLSLSAFAMEQSKNPVPGYLYIDKPKNYQIFTTDTVDETIKWDGKCINGFAEGIK